MLTVMNTEALILPADEDGADDVANDEDSKEDVVETVVVPIIEDGEEDETGSTGDCEYCRAC